MRPDIEAIPDMKSLGFKPSYSEKDIRYDRIECPHDSVGFSRTVDGIEEIVWSTPFISENKLINCWTRADIIDGHYCNHTRYASIEEFIYERKRINDLQKQYRNYTGRNRTPAHLNDYCVSDVKHFLDRNKHLEELRLKAIEEFDFSKAKSIEVQINTNRDKYEQRVKFFIEKMNELKLEHERKILR